MHKRFVFGSLTGAAVIHAAFIACGMIPASNGADSGVVNRFMETVQDAAVDALGIETRDARADDAGPTAACSCPVLPAPAHPTFSILVDRGSGPEEPMADYSTASVAASPALLDDGTPVVNLSGAASFRLADRKTFMVTCSVKARLDLTVVSGTLSCGPYEQIDASGAEVVSLSDHQVEFKVQRFTTWTGTAQSRQNLAFTNIVFRVSDPSAHFTIPPRAYQP